MQAHLDMGLPLIDIGCGNGRFARRLAPYVPSVLGVDLAANAIARAVNESGDVPNVTFRVSTPPHRVQRIPSPPGSPPRMCSSEVYSTFSPPPNVPFWPATCFRSSAPRVE